MRRVTLHPGKTTIQKGLFVPEGSQGISGLFVPEGIHSFLISVLAVSKTLRHERNPPSKPSSPEDTSHTTAQVCAFSADLETFLWGFPNSPQPTPLNFKQLVTILRPLSSVSSPFGGGNQGSLLRESLSSQTKCYYKYILYYYSFFIGVSTNVNLGNPNLHDPFPPISLHNSHPRPVQTDYSTWSRPQHMQTHG